MQNGGKRIRQPVAVRYEHRRAAREIQHGHYRHKHGGSPRDALSAAVQDGKQQGGCKDADPKRRYGHKRGQRFGNGPALRG